MTMDSAVVFWFASHRLAAADAASLALTVIGRAGLVFLVAAVVRGLVNRRLAMAAWQVCLAILLALLVSDGILKPLAHRPRPFVASPELAVVGERPAALESFPSGHAAACVAAACVLASSWPAASVGIWLTALLVAVSRVYLGVHYPSDVLAGALVGWAVGWFVLGRTSWRATVPRSVA